MKKFFTIFFVTLGVIFFGIILAATYFWIADPYDIKPIIFDSNNSGVEKTNNNQDSNKTATSTDSDIQTTASETTGSSITEGQKNALQLVGIDPTGLPERLTLEQEQCFVAEFGQARVDEIKAGAIPTPLEVLTGKNCI